MCVCVRERKRSKRREESVWEKSVPGKSKRRKIIHTRKKEEI